MNNAIGAVWNGLGKMIGRVFQTQELLAVFEGALVREPEISGPGAGQPARLRNSVSWVIQVFSGHCFGSSCSVFSS